VYDPFGLVQAKNTKQVLFRKNKEREKEKEKGNAMHARLVRSKFKETNRQQIGLDGSRALPRTRTGGSPLFSTTCGDCNPVCDRSISSRARVRCRSRGSGSPRDAPLMQVEATGKGQRARKERRPANRRTNGRVDGEIGAELDAIRNSGPHKRKRSER